MKGRQTEEMTIKKSGRLLAALGILCFAFAFVLLASFRGRFGQDTAGKQTVVMMEDTATVTPKESSVESDAPRQLASVADSGEAEENPAKYVVYVTGPVRKPGVYELPAGARIIDALKAAGGFTDKADTEAVNLAAKLSDGQQIKFLKKGEAAKLAAQNTAASSATATRAPLTASSGVGATASQSSGMVNLNTASQAELETIRGIGPKTAQAIIAYRTEHGGFRRKEDLMNVKGIGPKKYDSMKDSITTGN